MSNKSITSEDKNFSARAAVMASPHFADPLMTLSLEMAQMRLEIEWLHEVIALYIDPDEAIFSEDEAERRSYREALQLKRQNQRAAFERLLDIEACVQDLKTDVDRLARMQKPGKKTQEHLARTESILKERNNVPVSFTEMSRLIPLKEKARRQSMTKIGRIYEQHPEKYEVRRSKLGGKTVKLVPEYLKHLILEGA